MLDKDSHNEFSKGEFPRDTERFIDISGSGQYGKPKAHIILRYYEQFSDGSTNDIQSITIDKPIVNIFSHAGFVNVYLDFGSGEDMDLRMVYELLANYSRTENSVSYTSEELDSGVYDLGDGVQRMVYFPVVELILSPIGKETEYQIHGYNPADFSLAPQNLKGEISVIRFTFSEGSFVVVNDLEPIDLGKIQEEVMEELRSEADGIKFESEK